MGRAAHQGLADAVDVVGKAGGLAKGGAVVEAARLDGGLGANELQHLADGHAAGEAVRVHDEVGADAALAEGHVLLRHYRPHHPLLPVPAAELVPNLRPPRMPHQRLRALTPKNFHLTTTKI